ncbi:hypothetical protein LJC74_05665 [Eubacteriales bacterium OttesenSCG-928-A19]|nr:hypothetical protein [Eubacteriales bacterium OttesenSCG-928-A19]
MASYAYCALREFGIKPGEFMRMPRNEKAFVIAALEVKAEQEKKQEEEARRKQRTGGKSVRRSRRRR